MTTAPTPDLLPCPFCGAGNTEIRENGKVWSGMGYTQPTSTSVFHHCTPAAGQPSRAIERVGRDRASAIAAWNRRAELEARKPLPLSDEQIDAMAPGQEELAVQFCAEIAGPRGQPGSNPDPVRLLEMAEALYKAEADARLVDKSPNLQEPLVDKTANLQDRPASLIASREVVADGPVRVTRLNLTEEGRTGLMSKATGPLPGIKEA